MAETLLNDVGFDFLISFKKAVFFIWSNLIHLIARDQVQKASILCSGKQNPQGLSPAVNQQITEQKDKYTWTIQTPSHCYS